MAKTDASRGFTFSQAIWAILLPKGLPTQFLFKQDSFPRNRKNRQREFAKMQIVVGNAPSDQVLPSCYACST
jgi:hypothetical protein